MNTSVREILKRYEDLETLLANELVREDYEDTVRLIRKLRAARRRGYLTRSEFLAACRWKSPRSIRLCEQNSIATIRRQSLLAFDSRNERTRLEALVAMHGVSVATASAILTLTNPHRYGVIDIRVWQVLFDLKAVEKNARGVGFSVENWLEFLTTLRRHARKLNAPVRYVELSLFRYHQRIQEGVLYR